ncbi:hypothetical protein [Uliginosibacterium gangwonense]|uniref:hypothetical protein n=1 Tax=Uliginosibacterium gangwonense TaxID=392736 RepID=UPI000380418D|nr:hypothetical protein [Uliginosibacterium gangwonense]
MGTRYRILFRGTIQEGYDVALVRKLAAFRLNASLAKIERLFTGQKVFIKGGLPNEEIANQYVAEFAKLGMIVWAEPEPQTEKPHAMTTPTSVKAESQGVFALGSGYLAHPAADHKKCEKCPVHTTQVAGEALYPQKTTPNVALAEQILSLRTSLDKLQRARESGMHMSALRRGGIWPESKNAPC